LELLHVLNWRICRSGNGILNWVYASANEINFNNKIEGNQVLAIEIELYKNLRLCALKKYLQQRWNGE